MVSLTQTRSLSEAILDLGIQNTNFFNGRLLAAGDLAADQLANRQQHQQLGRAIGEGVVQGMDVAVVADGSDGSPPIVSVSQGLAINRAGQAVALGTNVTVALTRAVTTPPTGAGLFADCKPPSTSAAPLNAGLYVLTALPASGYQGTAAARGLSDPSVNLRCGSANAVEGASIRLVALSVASLTGLSQASRDTLTSLQAQSDAASRSRLRNLIAHACFGTEEQAAFLADPFSACGSGAQQRTYGAIDALRAAGTLTDQDVPLALLFWTQQGVGFLDGWAVRRRPMPLPAAGVWPGQRQRAEAEAMLLQFAAQVQAIMTAAGPSGAAIRAVDYFRYLPALGILPLSGFTAQSGIDSIAFVQGMTVRGPIVIEGALLGGMIAESLLHRPIDLTAKTLAWLYAVRENLQAQSNNVSARPPAVLVYASAYMPYRGNAQFDLGHWSFGNFAPIARG